MEKSRNREFLLRFFFTTIGETVMNNAFCFPNTGGVSSSSPFSSPSSGSLLDPRDPHDIQAVNQRLREICFEVTKLAHQLKESRPHCPRSLTQYIDECAACQRGEFGHVSDLKQHQESLFLRLQKLETEKEQCRHFLTRAHKL